MLEQIIEFERKPNQRKRKVSREVALGEDLRMLLAQADLPMQEMELVTKLIWDSARNIMRGIEDLRQQGMDFYELRERLSQLDFVPPKLHAARLGLSDDYTVKLDPELSTGKVVERWRKHRKIPAVNASRDAGLNETYIFMLEHERIKNPSYDALERIADQLEIDVEDILAHRVPVLVTSGSSENYTQ